MFNLSHHYLVRLAWCYFVGLVFESQNRKHFFCKNQSLLNSAEMQKCSAQLALCGVVSKVDEHI